MNRVLFLTLFAGLSLALPSCSYFNRKEVIQSDPGTRTISSVTPYSSLSDTEINAKYMVRLLELQSLNKEMDAANSKRDYGTVNSKAKEGLVKAFDARNLARNLDDARQREARLAGIGKIIDDLNALVGVSGG